MSFSFRSFQKPIQRIQGLSRIYFIFNFFTQLRSNPPQTQTVLSCWLIIVSTSPLFSHCVKMSTTDLNEDDQPGPTRNSDCDPENPDCIEGHDDDLSSSKSVGWSADEMSKWVEDITFLESKPGTSIQSLENFVLMQTIRNNPSETAKEMKWCILTYESPPNQANELRYLAALDYALLEGVDAIVIEPFDLAQRTKLWIRMMSIGWHLLGCWLSVTVAATLSSRMTNPGIALISIVNGWTLRLYRRGIMGDPISRYRNIDFFNPADMDYMFRMSELLGVRGAFTTVILKDVEREESRFKILTTIAGCQLGLSLYKFSFALLLRVFFPNREI